MMASTMSCITCKAEDYLYLLYLFLLTVTDLTGRLFIFDLDGTLIENKAFYYALEELKKFLKASISDETIARVFHDVYKSYVIKGDLRTAFDWDIITDETLRKLGIENKQKDIFYRFFTEYVNKSPPRIKDGVIDFLKRIRANNDKSILLTNGRKKFQELVLRRLGLFNYLDYVLTNDDVPRAKPFREAYEYALKVVGARDLSNAYYVGDHIYYDLYGALKAGINNVFFINNDIPSGIYKVSSIRDKLVNFTRQRYGIDISDSLRDILNKEFIVINEFSELPRLVFGKD